MPDDKLLVSSQFEVRADAWPLPVPTALIEDVTNGNITDGAFVTFVSLILFQIEDAEEDGKVPDATREGLAKRRGISKRTFQGHLAQLRARGWIEYEDVALTLLEHRKAAA